MPGPGTALQVAALVRESMEGAASLRVPLRVKLHSGPSWGELRELQL
jgi:DNA polymerase I-like protein with 3'-5' exonuclease and polymerase domains